MSRKVILEKFELRSVKLNNKKGLDVSFFDLDYTNKLLEEKSNNKASIDFYNAFNQLKEVFAYSLGYHNGWNFARENNRKNEDVLKKSILFWKDEIDKFAISQVTLMGVSNSLGIKINGTMKTELGFVKVTSPVIRFDSDVNDANDESIMLGDLAETAFNQIQLEVYYYCMTNKTDGEFHFTEDEEEEEEEDDIIESSVFE